MDSPLPNRCALFLATVLVCGGQAAIGSAHEPGTLCGSTVHEGEGWVDSPWYGRFHRSAATEWIHHEQHGWQYLSSAGNGSCYTFDHETGGWWWVSPDVYPWFYLFGDAGGWIFYRAGTAAPHRWFRHSDHDRFTHEGAGREEGFRVLVFSKTTGFRHDSIPAGIAAIEGLGEVHGFAVDSTEDANRFTDEVLAAYAAVVFLSTSGEVFDDPQRNAFQAYIRRGGGFAGIHAASTTERGWAWFGDLVGAWFTNHPPGVSQATLHVETPDHPSTRNLPETWRRVDEWYNFDRNPREDVHVLITVNPRTFTGGEMGSDHPLAWYHEFEGGRSWYTALGHTIESFEEPFFLMHILGGIEYAAGAPESP